MSTLAVGFCSGPLSGRGSPAAGDTGRSVQDMAGLAVKHLKAGLSARTNAVFNDLYALIQENSLGDRSSLAGLAQRFLLALPTALPAPSLSLDDDKEVSFDWSGSAHRLMTVTLREDGRLTYAARLSAFNKEHGTKWFDEAVPQRVIELVQEATAK
jgi:hypothetical protein